MSVRRNREWLKKAARQLRLLRNPRSPISQEIAQWLAASFEAYLKDKSKLGLEHALGLVKEAGQPKDWRMLARIIKLKDQGKSWKTICDAVERDSKTVRKKYRAWTNSDEFAQRRFEKAFNTKVDKEVADANLRSLKARGDIKKIPPQSRS